jgi:EAL and modified HD-GYP domain-containing signal transduction protein
MLVSDIAEATDEQLSMTMARAKLCETLAPRLDAPPESAFTVGLLWGVADILGVPVADLVSRLPLAQEVADALVSRRGQLGQVLAMVQAYEQADGTALAHPEVSPTELTGAYLASVGWTMRTMRGVLGSHQPRRIVPPRP